MSLTATSDIAKPKPKKNPGRPKKPRRGDQPGHEQHLGNPFPIAKTRSREVLERLLGEEFAGYLNFDIKAQYCGTHLIRDMRFLSEKHPDKKILSVVIDESPKCPK